jgi:hypothetical protein
MSESELPLHPIGQVEVDGKRFAVSLRTAYDGVEHVGKLWFTDLEGATRAIPDHGAVSGPTAKDAVEAALRLSADDLARRCRRAHADKRRYLKLRSATDSIIEQIKYMNRVAVSMRTGVIDMEGANQEIELAERQIQELVTQLRSLAGVEG